MSIDVYPNPVDVILGTMAQQNANAVAITGGTISGLTGFNVDQRYIGNPTGDNKFGIWCDLAAAGGTSRYFLYSPGNAPNQLNGNLGIGVYPAYPLDVTGQVRVMGSIGLGTTPTGHPLWINYDHSGLYAFVAKQTVDTGSGAPALFVNAAGTAIGSITTTASATSFNTSSDVRLKYAIEKLVGSLDVIKLLNPVKFKYKVDDSPGEGFLAHELQQVIPAAVTGEPHALTEEGEILPQQVDASKILPWLAGACQELAQQVQTLSARVAYLEARLA